MSISGREFARRRGRSLWRSALYLRFIVGGGRNGVARRGRRRLLALFVGVAPFVALELVLRACGFEYPRLEVAIRIWDVVQDQELAQGDGLHRLDDRQMWVPRAGAAIPWAPDERVSPQGFRGGDPDPLCTWKVLTLGDSSTFGWGMARHEPYSALLADLQRALDPSGTAWLGIRSARGTRGTNREERRRFF